MTDIQKVAIVTGASQGLGAGIVNAYRSRGWRVVATSRSIEPSHDPDLVTIAADIGDPDTGKKLVQTALERFGRVDSLINNAGIFIPSVFTDYTEDQYRLKNRTNLDGFFFTTQAAVPLMLEQGGGLIVQITTTLVEHAMSQVPSVLASLTKGGLSAATKSLAIEFASKGIRVNAIAPGLIKTPMHTPESEETLAKLHPVGRMGEISDITKTVMFLEDVSFITGETIHVDGGIIAGH